MKKYLCLFFLLVSCGTSFAVTCNTPSSSYPYVSGQVINPTAVQTNENNMYTYLQQGVCNYLAGSITQAAISSTAGILYSQLNLSGGVLPGDINTSTTTNIYTFGEINVPNNLTIASTGTFNYGTENQGDILYDNGTNFIRLPIGTQGQTLQATGSAIVWSSPPYVEVAEQETSGTSGGAATTGSFQTRVLNKKLADTQTIASLCTGNNTPVSTCTAANQVVLPAGTYHVMVESPYCQVTNFQTRLEDVTSSSVLLLGNNGTNPDASGVCSPSIIMGIITLASPQALSVQYRSSASTNTSDLGFSTSFGTETYTVAEFTKVS